MEETSTGYRDLTDVGFPGGDSAAAGVTSLAAATAAIISARWSGRSDGGPASDPIAVNGHGRRDVHFGDHGHPAEANGHAPNGHPTNGYAANGHAADGHAANGYPANGFAANGHAANGHATNGFAPNGHGGYAQNEYGPGESHDAPADSGFHDNPPFQAHPFPPDGDALPHRIRGSASVAPAGPRSLFEPAPAPPTHSIFDAPAPPVFDAPAPPAFETSGPTSLFEPRSAPPFPASAPEPFPPAGDAYQPADVYPQAYVAPQEQYRGERAPSLPAHDFSGSVMAGLVFPAPFEPEPYEAYDPFEPKPRPNPVDPLDIDTEPMLPQRVPAEPDVPNLVLPPNDPLRDPATATMSEPRQLTRIAQALRDDDGTMAERRPDGFDLDAVLDAVRAVPDVSDAHLRWNPESGHTLRIEFKDGVDEGQVTRRVVQLLRESMGLAAEPNGFDEVLERTGGGPDRSGAGLDQTGGRVRASAAVVSSRPVPGQRHEARPLPPARRGDGGLGGLPRVVLDHVQMARLGHDATLEVRLAVSHDGARAEATSVGTARGPAVDAYLLRLAAQAAGDAVDRLLIDPATGQSKGRTFVEHATVVSFGGCEVAVVVLLLAGGPNPEQLSGSTIVTGDPVQAVVRATLSALNRRMESLLS